MGKTVVLSANLVPFFRLFTIPNNETLDAVAKLVFPDALYIFYIICYIMLKLPKTDHKTFVTWLETFPRGFTNSFVSLNYVNGTLVLLSHCHIMKPNPYLLNKLLDKIDHIEKAG